MAYTLDTTHPLYGNIIECIGVENGALVSLVTPRTFTKHADASYGTGTYGEHFSSAHGGYTAKGASFSPAVTLNTTANPNITIFIAANASGSVTGTGMMVGSTSSNTPSIGRTSSKATALSRYNSAETTGTTDIANNGAHSFAITRTGETSHELYVDGSLDGSGGMLSYAGSPRTYDYIGGVSGQTSLAQDYVWIVWFDKVLSSTEISDLHTSLGSGNSFALITSGATDTTAPILSTPTGSATGDTTASGSVSTDEDNGTLYAVATTSGTAPGDAQIQAGQDNAGTAAAYATSQAVSTTGVQNVSATGLSPSTTYYWHYQHQDAAGNNSTVETSASFTTDAAADTTPDAYVFTDQTGAALSTVTTSDTITVTGIDSSTPISITGGEYSINGGAYTAVSGNVVLNDTVTLRVTSSASYSTSVNVDLDIGGVLDTWSVTTMAEPVGTITLPAMKNNTGTVNASDTGLTIDVYSIATGTLVERFTGETTDASGICAVSSVNLVAATAYTVVVRRSTNAIGCAEITAT